MPLIPCPDCQSEISDTAPSCIKCGRPMGDDPDKDRKGFRKVEKIQKVEVVKPKKKLFSFWNIIIFVILFIFFFSLFSSSFDDSSTIPNESLWSPVTSTNKAPTPKPKADPNANAVAQAESYLSHSSFSKESLYDQLIYEKYTSSQARYAVNTVFR